MYLLYVALQIFCIESRRNPDYNGFELELFLDVEYKEDNMAVHAIVKWKQK